MTNTTQSTESPVATVPATAQEASPEWPASGLGATICHWTDRTACTILAVSASRKTITLRPDRAELDNWKPVILPGGFAGHCINQHEQRYRYSPDPTAKVIRARLRKDGAYRTRDDERVIPGRRQFHDYNY